MTGLLQSFVRDDNGQGMVEYALVVALVAIGLIAILTIFRNSIGNIFNHSRNEMNDVNNSSYGEGGNNNNPCHGFGCH
jgi:pilus assembly protein Flp/PilA